MTGMNPKLPKLWIHVTPSEISGQWVSHCLNFDVVSQGDSPEHAYQMALEATELVVLDDLAHGLNPFDRAVGLPLRGA
jgi:predicted RNase H-like HicB family nuclease